MLLSIPALLLPLLSLLPSALAIPPEDFGFPSAPNDTALGVAFTTANNVTIVREAALYGVDTPASPPTLAVDTGLYRSLAQYTGAYLVLMVDPDVPTPTNPTSRFLLHWLAPNFRPAGAAPSALRALPGTVLTNRTANTVSYRRPSPGTTSDAHRYILYAFAQPANFSIPPAFTNFTDANRAGFNLTRFVAQARLGAPLAAQYFFVSNKTGVPGGFQAAPGGTYPGGNGAAVTAGPGPVASATGAATSTAASASRTAAATSTGGAAVAGAAWGLLSVGVLGAVALV